MNEVEYWTKIKDWDTFKEKMKNFGYQEVGAFEVPYRKREYARKGPGLTAFSKKLDREVNVPYVFEDKETKITKLDRVAVFVEEGKLYQIRLKFDIEDWPHHTDLDLLYPEHREKLPSELESLAREIENEVKLALSG